MAKLILTMRISSEYDVVAVRQQSRQVAIAFGFSTQEQARISTAVSEIARNALKYAQGGKAEFLVDTSAVPRMLLVEISDTGPGIKDVAAVMEGRLPGMGVIGAKRLVDHFEIDSTPGRGTTVTLGIRFPAYAPEHTEAEIERIAAALGKREPQSPFEEIQRQNQELLAALHQLQQRTEELARVNRELEDTNRGVIALYAELEERAEYLRHADELKTKFLSYLSHEFRTPLNSITALSQMLLDRLDGDLTPEQEKQADFIHKSARALIELVNDLLDLSRIEAGKATVNVSRFEVANLFNALKGVIKPLRVNPHVNLVFEEPAGIPPLETDEPKVSQILRNLLSNALKFTEQGEVRISAMTPSADSRFVLFSVSDTGIGIAPDDQERIFLEFVQAKASPSKVKVKGTGLGLAISRRLANLLGGNLTVQSELGKGSTFTLRLPIGYKGPHEVSAEEQTAREDAARHPILVVEDKTEDLAFYEQMLDSTGFQMFHARTVTQARELLARITPVAVILDILLPDGSGWELLSEIKRDQRLWSIPVIVVTVVHDPDKAQALGADDYCVKPVDRDWLLAKLNELARTRAVDRILIVDDQETDLYVLRSLLAGTKYEIIEAADGREAIKRARSDKPQVIFLDLIMPGMDGFETLRRLKRDPATRDIPVIVYTSKVLTDAEREALACGASAIIQKGGKSREEAIDELHSLIRKLKEDRQPG